MTYEAELLFFKKLIQNLNLECQIVTEPFDDAPFLDKGLRALLYPGMDFRHHFIHFPELYKPRIIYRAHDRLKCNYILLQLPDMEKITYLIIGPYLTEEFSGKRILELCELLSLPPHLLSQLEKYYQEIPLISDGSLLLVLVNTFGERIWEGIDNFTLQDVQDFISADIAPVADRPEDKKTEEAFLAMRALEDRYARENLLMQAVSTGQVHKAETINSSFPTRWMENRNADALRNAKNYTIIFNTLLRKAAEAGAVHPLHIDSLSSRFAKMIELASSEKAIDDLQTEMIRKYCLLVKNHSMKKYSFLVQKVLTQIDSDLTADLSLKTQAALLHVNPSYLSTLFKKETKSTLTDYVNHKRMERAVFLLNSTSMQIQTIAQLCGIPDVNYFTKIFKKLVGSTPTQYREKLY